MNSASTVASSVSSPCSNTSEITEYAVLLKNIPRDLTRSQVQTDFVPHVSAKNIRIPPRKTSKGVFVNRGYARVIFFDLNEAMELVNKMDGFQIDANHIIQVEASFL
jgi:RNA recognition motif-containing protein